MAPVLTALVWAAGSCVDVQGGAVELSWQIRTMDGRTVDSCTFDTVRLAGTCWPDVAACAGPFPAGDPWPCGDRHGATEFEIPSGTWSLTIQPGCDDAALSDPATVRVPDPIVREIAEGQVRQLGALLIEVASEVRLCPGEG